MKEIFIAANAEDMKELKDHLRIEGYDLKKKNQFNLNENELLHYITAGGGLLGLAKCILSFIKLKYQKRTVSIKKRNGDELTIEGHSVEEVHIMLQDAQSILIKEKTAEEDD